MHGYFPQSTLEVRGVTKRFPGVVALKEVDFHVDAGEVVALVGENGAGKSTLMKILAGVQAPDEGTVTMDGQALGDGSVAHALSAGIALIHQELNLAGNLSIAANLFLGREPSFFGWIDRKTIRRESACSLEKVGLDLNPDTLVGTLSMGQQQLVEIAKALSVQAKVLIMDEPTSSLSLAEAEILFGVIHDLKRQGVSVIYISHRLYEVRELAERVIVFRDGENVGELRREELSHEALVRMMVGRDVSQLYQRTHHELGEEALRVRDFRTRAFPDEAIDFAVRAGEIVGIAGLVGAGRTELLEAIFGVKPALGGEVTARSASFLPKSPRQAMQRGLALVPEDRKAQGLLLEMSVRDNTSLAVLKNDARGPFRNRSREDALCAEMTTALKIKTPGPEQRTRNLSGGNQQKVVLGKWLACKPTVLLLDEPTRGVDIGAKEEIYRLMEKFASDGMAVVFVSSELEEIMGMADRALVMHEGRLVGELARRDFSEEAMMKLATNS